MAREAAMAGRLPEVVALAGGDPEGCGVRTSPQRPCRHPDARRVIEQVGWWVGFGLANLACVLDPECFVLGAAWSAPEISSSIRPGAPSTRWSKVVRPVPPRPS